MKNQPLSSLNLKTFMLCRNKEGYFVNYYFREITNPVIIKRTYDNISKEDFILFSSTDFGALLIEGFGDGVWAECSFIEKDETE